MKTISLKIDDDIFGDTEQILAHINKPRNRYINEALDFYNSHNQRKYLESKLKSESELVGRSGMQIVNVFEQIDNAS